MENKYYVPELSEFTILDFEFEYRSNKTDSEGNSFTTEWTRKNFNSIEKWCSWDAYGIQRLIEANNIRVKYLDQADIESLGFEHDFNDDGEEYPSQFEEHGTSKGYHIDTQDVNDTAYILYYFSDNFIIIDKIYKCGSRPYMFQGYIKNKSELKRILKQIGINESIQENNKK